MKAFATATGGEGGGGNGVSAEGGNATATARAESSGDTNHVVQATAVAQGGRGGLNQLNGTRNLDGESNAVARALASNGAAATANATATGNLLGLGAGSATAQAVTAGGGFKLLQVEARAPVSGTVTAQGAVKLGGDVPAASAPPGVNAFSFASGAPSAASLAAALAGNTNANAVLASPGVSVLLGGAMGARHAPGLPIGATHQAALDFTVDISRFSTGGALRLGLLDPSVIGTGFSELRFSVLYEGVQVINELFTSLAAALSYFDDQVVKLSDFTLATGDLDVNIDLEWTGLSSSQGFAFNFLVGTDAAYVAPPLPGGGSGGGFPPTDPPVTPPGTDVPEPASLLLLAAGLAHLARQRRRRA